METSHWKPSVPKFFTVCITSKCGSLYLFLSAAVGSFSNNGQPYFNSSRSPMKLSIVSFFPIQFQVTEYTNEASEGFPMPSAIPAVS